MKCPGGRRSPWMRFLTRQGPEQTEAGVDKGPALHAHPFKRFARETGKGKETQEASRTNCSFFSPTADQKPDRRCIGT